MNRQAEGSQSNEPDEHLEKDLRLAFEQGVTSDGEATACPDSETIARAVLEATGPTLSKLTEHARSCGRCAGELALASSYAEAGNAGTDLEEHRVRAITRSLPSPVSDAAQVDSTLASSRWPWIGVAAAALLIVTTWTLRQAGPPSLPDRSVEQVVRGGTIGQLAPTGEIAQAPRRLSWRSIDGVETYSVTLATVDSDPLLEGETRQNFLVLEDELRARLQPHVRYQWHVIARAAGSDLARSASESFVIEVASRSAASREPK